MSSSPACSRPSDTAWRDASAWLCLLPALLLLPFLGKAFHIDDTQFLIYARLIGQHPLDPFSQVFEWDSMRVAIIDFPHPLFWQYLLAGASAIFGESERALHLLSFGFGLLALRSLRGLALRMGVSPLAACVLLAGSSGFLVMGSTIMPDVAAMALSLAAIERLVASHESERLRDALLAGLLAALAFLTRFTAVFALGLLLVHPLLTRCRRPRAYLPLAVALAGVVASELWSLTLTGRPHFLSSVLRWSSPASLARDLHFAFDELTFLGAQLPTTGLALFALAARSRSARLALIASGAAVLALAVLLSGDAGLVAAALLFAWPGLLLIVDAAARLARGAAARFEAPDARTALRWLLSLWLIGTTFATLRYEHVAVKYLLLPLPAALLLVLDRLSGLRGRLRRIGTWMLWASCAVGVATGLAVALSDYRWAGSYRAFVAENLEGRSAGRPAIYVNAQWGLRFYAERAGLAPYRGGRLRRGERVLVSTRVPPNWKLPERRWQVVARYPLSYSGPFALLDSERRAGFYSNAWGDYPFVPASSLSEMLLLLREPEPEPSEAPRAPAPPARR